MDPPNDIPYAKNRYRAETGRLYKVLDTQLARHEFVAGDFYSIADMAVFPWASLWEGQQQTLDDKPNMRRWLDTLSARPAVDKGRNVHIELRGAPRDTAAKGHLFKQK